MFSSSSSKGKSSGLRILWIPGGRKSHPKGRYSSTNKNVSYSTQPKRKNESWSLGGSRNQKGLLEADPDTALLDGPSVSGLSAASCALGTAGVVGKCIKSEEILSVETHTEPAAATPAGENATPTNGTDVAAVTTTTITTTTTTETENASPATTTITTTTGTPTENGPATAENQAQNLRPPSTPDSTTSTAPLLSPTFPSANNIEMPSKTATKASTHTTTVTTVTKADVIDQENRFAILDDDLKDVVQLHRMRTLPRGDADEVSLQRNSLPDMPQTPSSSSVVTSRSSSSASPQHSTGNSNTNSDSNHSSPVKKKHQRHRNHNNNHQQVISDLNTIESIHEESKIPNGSVDWIDDLVKDSTGEGDSVSTAKPKTRKKRNSKDMDQLDGISKKSISPSTDESDDGDEKFVTCLHYTLMCCDCSIS